MIEIIQYALAITALSLSYGLLTLLLTYNMFNARNIKLGYWMKVGIVVFWFFVVAENIVIAFMKKKKIN